MKHVLVRWPRNLGVLALMLATSASFAFASTGEGPGGGNKKKVKQARVITVAPAAEGARKPDVVEGDVQSVQLVDTPVQAVPEGLTGRQSKEWVIEQERKAATATPSTTSPRGITAEDGSRKQVSKTK